MTTDIKIYSLAAVVWSVQHFLCILYTVRLFCLMRIWAFHHLQDL